MVNPRVDGSIPSLATTSKLDDFHAVSGITRGHFRAIWTRMG
jgi:hypothetical protein